MKTNLTPFTPNKLGQVFRITRLSPVTVLLESPLHTLAMYCYGASFYKIPFKKKKDIEQNGKILKAAFRVVLHSQLRITIRNSNPAYLRTSKRNGMGLSHRLKPIPS